jgi:DNA-binding transcriptional LysR family regulator
MNQLKRMAVFAEVVAAGSMVGAARHLGMTASAVSQHVGQLEKALGLALLHRSTRRLTLTEAGERYSQGCIAMLQAAKSAEQALEALRDEPEGELRLSAPVGSASLLASALAPLRAYPRLTLRLLLDDALVDLVQERVDVALRMGELADSTLVARKLGHLPRQLCAAPAYLAERGWPAHPADLAQHHWVGGRPGVVGPDRIVLRNAQGEEHALELECRAHATQAAALHSLCVAGWGIGVGIGPEAQKALAEGLLLPVLPQWRLDDLPIYAVTQRRAEQPAKVRFALEALQNYFVERRGWV